jgi:hypothetical protein
MIKKPVVGVRNGLFHTLPMENKDFYYEKTINNRRTIT